MADHAAFGEAVKDERIRVGLTAEDAASRAGLAYKTWLRIESGKPVRNLSYGGVDRLFGLPEGTSLIAVAQDKDPFTEAAVQEPGDDAHSHAYGRFLKARREEVGMSQETLAQATSLGAQSTVWKIENGKRGLLFHEAVELAGVLGFSLSAMADAIPRSISREQWWARVGVALTMARHADDRKIAELTDSLAQALADPEEA